MMKRGSGILLHITSLPSKFGIGDLGPDAFRFVDFLAESGQKYWQLLPLNPTNPGGGNSPYYSSSAFAGNPLMISPELLEKDGLLCKSDIKNSPDFPKNQVDFDSVISFKTKLLKTAFKNFRNNNYHLKNTYSEFCSAHSIWLHDFTLFSAIKDHFGQKIWTDWPKEIRECQPEALDLFKEKLAEQIEFGKFLQFIFFQQWSNLKKYCEKISVEIIGDVPYYVSLDSAAVWMNYHIFKLDESRHPTHIAGVPPDYFSKTGQLWGNPVYRWEILKEQKYKWWINRLNHNLAMYHWIRIDHFRGFVGYWEVEATEKTAINGKWVKAPAEDFFNTLLQENPRLPIIAEDLGVITDDVKEIIDRFNFPGMRILQFAFDKNIANNSYAPHNHIPNCLVYTGTHDNNTIKGWFEEEIDAETKKRLSQYIGASVRAKDINWELIRLALMSVANMAIIPIQDILGLNSDAKMNRPGTANGNWRWRLEPRQISKAATRKLRNMTQIYGRI